MVNKHKYVPEYAKGEILVKFKDSEPDGGFVSEFGKRIGYILSDESSGFGDYFCYKTLIGKEKEAIANFQKKKYAEFVENACLRDKKAESRWDSLEDIIDVIQDLRDDVEISDKAYNKKIEEMIGYLKNIK